MKKLLILLIALVMVLSLAACGKSETAGNGENPSGNIGDGGSGGTENTADGGENSNIPDIGKTKVETKSDRVVTTMNDGTGNIAVTEYIYKDGVLYKIIMTMQCLDSTAAKTLYDTYTTGEMKEYGEQHYSDIRLDGKNVIHTFNESYMSSFSDISMEQLASALDGAAPLTGGESTGDNSNQDDGSDDIETVYNYTWGDMNLPDGFPKLADGVTGYIEVEGGAMLSWNAMAFSDLETMLEKLEEWSGLTIEKTFEADGAIAWSAENDELVITINYWSDSIDMQVIISIQEF